MKNCKSILCRLVCVVLAAVAATACMTVSASAAEPVAVRESAVMPRYNNGGSVERTFYISPSGLAQVFCDVTGVVDLQQALPSRFSCSARRCCGGPTLTAVIGTRAFRELRELLTRPYSLQRPESTVR